ncbi:hypothetical protein RN001_011920 [Aquatica leii]|uniref:Uncharacterized protein n=1 Tax=Aquatica leii TaxID=1421715 RepID=A0AAN7P4W0_9COLE|nr:hypothetical protein RN001_011920 [Aquatica leii]
MQIPLSKWNICFLCIGAILAFAGAIILIVSNSINEAIISAAFRFEPGTAVYKAWQKPSDPIIMNIYILNWTNPEDINNPNVKPKFVEVGPYRYKHTKEKTDIVWNSHNKTVTYNYLKHFYFDEDHSLRHHSDVVTTINTVPLTIAHIANDWHLVPQLLISSPVKNSAVYVRKNVSELLFGYEDSVLSVMNSIPILTNPEQNKYGFFYGRNGTIGSDGVFNMKTEGEEFGTLQNWNYQNHTGFFKGHCGEVYGSAGEMYPRNLKPTYIYLFSSEMCRTAKLNFVRNVTVKDILGYKFAPEIEVFDNGSKLKENVCYDNKYPSGILNISSCKDHAPVYLSLPHFYYADPSYVDAVEGLYPEKNKHELYVAIEPKTGVIIDLSARLQINVQLQPLPGFGKFADLPNLLFPVLWFEQVVLASDDLASNLKLLFRLPLIIEIFGTEKLSVLKGWKDV